MVVYTAHRPALWVPSPANTLGILTVSTNVPHGPCNLKKWRWRIACGLLSSFQAITDCLWM